MDFLAVLVISVALAVGGAFLIAHGQDISNKFVFVSGIMLLVVSFCDILLVILSSVQPWQIESEYHHELKYVVWPDGTKSQMIDCEGQTINITSKFGKIFDEKEWFVRRVKYVRSSYGIYWRVDEQAVPPKSPQCLFLENRKVIWR